MFIFPLVYVTSFLISLKEILKGNKSAVFLFLIFGLSIYTTTMSVVFKFGFGNWVDILKTFKESIIIVLLGWSIYSLKTKIKYHSIDYALIIFLLYSLLYAVLPIGEQGFSTKLFALKSISFFTLVYFLGRVINFQSVFLSKYFLYIMILALAAGIIVLFEAYFNTHLQTLTNYSAYNFYFFNNEVSGNYGLTWTFESAGGFKRFASFFSNPLEHAGATILSLSVLIAFYTDNNYKIKIDLFGLLVAIMTLISIFFAVSRSSFVSYFLIIYGYGWLTNKKYIVKIFHLFFIFGLLYLLYGIIENFDEEGLYKVVVSTLNFTDASSLGHVLEWVQGVTSIYTNPLGIGLGTSGNVAGSLLGETVGGENQFLIIGVQIGLVGLIIYTFVYIKIAWQAKYWYYRLSGVEKKLCLLIVLLKIGLLIPLLTSEMESSAFVSYTTWFLTGLFVNMISNKVSEK